MTQRVLVTGGAGFIGSHVAALHVAAGDAVTVLDDLSSGRRENVPPGARFVQADVRSAEARQLLAEGGFDVLSHHAAQADVRRSVVDPRRDADVNLIGLLNVLEAARAGGVRRVVAASSGGAIYADGAALPAPEHAPKLPASPYGTAKLAAEYYLATYAQLYHLEYVALRYSNVYGPRQPPEGEAGVVAIFAGGIAARRPLIVYGDGEQTRDFVYVGDVAEANLLAARCPLPSLRDVDAWAFNIGTGIETSVNRLAYLLADVAGHRVEVRHAPGRPGENRRSALDATKAATIGWRPLTALADGLRLTFRALAG